MIIWDDLNDDQKNDLKKAGKIIAAILAAILLLILITPKQQYHTAPDTFRPQSDGNEKGDSRETDDEEKPVLEATFLRWYQEKGELYVRFRFRNNGKEPISVVRVSCTGLDATGEEAQRFRESV